MQVVLLIAALVAGTLAGPRVPAFQTGAPWLGTWELDPERSVGREDPTPYLRTTFRIELWGDGLKVTYDMIGIRGGRPHLEWTGGFDSEEYPVEGVDYVLTNAYRLIDSRTYEIVVKVDGVVAATTRVEVSPDGQILTAVTTETDTSGHAFTSTAVYDRN
jgi:hypothetical protein